MVGSWRPSLQTMDAVYMATKICTHQQELRLITSLPTSTSKGLHCDLQSVSLLDKRIKDSGPVYDNDIDRSIAEHCFRWGDFAALSYVWGDPHDTTRIVVNATRTHVTKNLASALHTLQRTGKF